MLRNFASKILPLRRAAFAGALALATAAAFIPSAAPAAAFGSHGGIHMHSGFGGGMPMHGSFGGGMPMHGNFGSGFHMHDGFHHGFHRRFFAFGFGGPGYFAGYPYDDTSADDGCLRRVWRPYGWRVINICY